MKARLKTFAMVVAGLAIICPRARAQVNTAPPPGLVKEVEKGNSVGALGARLGVFLTENERFASGFELGYAGLSGLESEMHMGTGEELELHLNRTDRRLWYATYTVRRHWLDLGNTGGLYAGGGTGVYYLRNKSELWEPNAAGPSPILSFRESVDGSVHFGLNFGGGWTFSGTSLPGAFDLDARFHLLPFAGGSGVRSLLTFSAGLHLF